MKGIKLVEVIKRLSVSEQIIEHFLEQIENGSLKPGDRLPPEREMTEQLKVSRVSLREAISALSAFGILSARQGEGTSVNRFNTGILGRMMYIYTILDAVSENELMEMRNYLESAAAASAAEKRTEEQLMRMEQANDQFAENILQMGSGRCGLKEVFEADHKFHSIIAEASGNKLFAEFLDAVRGPVLRAAEKKAEADGLGLEESVNYHKKIYEAIKTQDKAIAYKVMSQHVQHITTALAEK